MDSNYNNLNIQCLNIDVSKKIKNQNINKFIHSSLKLNNINITSLLTIYCHYLEDSNQYQIIIIKEKVKYFIAEILSILYLEKETKNSVDLYITDKFLLVYKDAKFYYYQKLDYKLEKDELIKFIQKKLNLKVINTIYLEDSYLEVLSKEYTDKYKKSSLIDRNIKKDYSFKIYLFFLLFLSSCIYLYFLESRKITVDESLFINKNLQLKKTIKSYKFKSFHDELLVIMDKIKVNKLKMIDIDYSNKNVQVLFTSLNKKQIYKFLDFYRNRILTSSISFNVSKKIFECKANVQVSK